MNGFILACGVGLAGAAGIALAGQIPQAPAAAGTTSGCLTCHPDARVAESVHRDLACLDCHPGAAPRPGDPPHPAKKDLPPPDCTSRCHRGPAATPEASGRTPLAYPDSAHGRGYLERNEPEVARCWDCHGKHTIKAASDPASTVNRANVPTTCSRCHEDMSVVIKYNIHAESPYREYRQSVHGRALFEKGLVSFAAVCTDCHGAHDIQAAGAPHLRAKSPETCGRCHVLILDAYAQSIHGRQYLAGNPDVPGCVDCHGEHTVSASGEAGAPTSKAKIPDTCSTCHARPEIMKKYGVPEDRIKTFIESFHGIAIGFGDKAEASCTSCHGVHDILPAADPKSSVHPANLAATCGQTDCHPGMPARIAEAKVHRDVKSPKSGIPYYVQKILFWLVIVAAAATIVWFVPELFRRARRRPRPRS
jgi:5-methylcytosine-specific restriction endonuclease McrA